MRYSRIPSLVLADEARRRMPQRWFRVMTVWNGDAVEFTTAPLVKWRWAEPTKNPEPVPTVEDAAHDRRRNMSRHVAIPKVVTRYG